MPAAARRPSVPADWTPSQTFSRRLPQPRGARSHDPEAHTVEAVLATGYRVKRWYGMEELSLTEASVDLMRVALGQCRFIDHHNAYQRSAVLGTLTSARLERGMLMGTIRFHDTPQGRAAEADAANGDMTGISIGYRINKLVLAESNEGSGEDVYRAESWELLEVSSVSVPADPHAGVRSIEAQPEQEFIMEPAAEPTAPAPGDRAQIDVQIRELGALARLGDDFTADLIERHLDVPAARAAVQDEMQRRSSIGVGTGVSPGSRPSGDDPAVLIERMAEALAHRMNPGLPLSEPARQYRGMRLVDNARVLLTARGERLAQWASPDSIFQRANTTSDFPMLLTATGNRVLLPAYEAAASPLKLLARSATINDFRAKSALRLGAMGRLEKVRENGEVTHTSRGEAKESYSLSTFARMFSMTRQALVNDDLSAFGDFTLAGGRAAAQTEADELVALLTANSGNGVTMDDQQPLFHSTHGNIADSGAAPDVGTLGAGRLAMRSQVGLGGELINVAPATLLVGAELETEAEKLLASIYAATIDNANPFSGRLKLLIEPRLSGGQWFLFADPARAAVLEYAHLAGFPGPQMDTRQGWEVLGVEFRVVLDYGCGALDWRGAYRNAGAGA